MTNSVPQYHELFNPLLQALRNLGGSARNDELVQEVVKIMNLSDSVAGLPHGTGGLTEVAYRLAWARTYLKKYGLLENSARGVWIFNSKGATVTEVDPNQVVAYVRSLEKKPPDGTPIPSDSLTSQDIDEESRDDDVSSETTWKGELMETLLKMEPSSFERLVIRMLRESGFDDVKVTGKSGDGGIDGKGIVRINGILSFHAIVQCKRYKPDRLISASDIRDFRGAMTGRTDKGIFITTSGFTRAAIEEATRDGAPPLDLINGEQLVEIMKELRLGVSEKRIIVVNKDWLLQL